MPSYITPEELAAWMPVIVALVIWSLPWKGYALWLAARNNHPRWFVALLVINTVAILDIIYIFAIGRPAIQKREAGAE